MFRKILITVSAISLLLIAAVGVYAQQGGGGRGNGGPPDDLGRNNNPCEADCIGEPQMNGYGNGANSFGNGRNGPRWNDPQRGPGSMNNQGAGQNGLGSHNNLPPANVDQLPQEVIDLMIAGWLDEQHAYTTYTAIMTQFGDIRPFVNIRQAEAQHAEAWEFLFDRYRIATPNVPAFDIPVFETRQEACAAAVAAEIANFDLYDDMLTTFEPYPDLYQVALSLRNASEFNHLPAFQNCAGF
jgi:hypothetical protein